MNARDLLFGSILTAMPFATALAQPVLDILDADSGIAYCVKPAHTVGVPAPGQRFELLRPVGISIDQNELETDEWWFGGGWGIDYIRHAPTDTKYDIECVDPDHTLVIDYSGNQRDRCTYQKPVEEDVIDPHCTYGGFDFPLSFGSGYSLTIDGKCKRADWQDVRFEKIETSGNVPSARPRLPRQPYYDPGNGIAEFIYVVQPGRDKYQCVYDCNRVGYGGWQNERDAVCTGSSYRNSSRTGRVSTNGSVMSARTGTLAIDLEGDADFCAYPTVAEPYCPDAGYELRYESPFVVTGAQVGADAIANGEAINAGGARIVTEAFDLQNVDAATLNQLMNQGNLMQVQGQAVSPDTDTEQIDPVAVQIDSVAVQNGMSPGILRALRDQSQPTLIQVERAFEEAPAEDEGDEEASESESDE